MEATTDPNSRKDTSMSRFLRDLIERAFTTYVEVFLGLLIASNTFAEGQVDLTVLRTAAVSAIPAVLSVVKSMVGGQYGNGDSASLSPKV